MASSSVNLGGGGTLNVFVVYGLDASTIDAKEVDVWVAIVRGKMGILGMLCLLAVRISRLQKT